MLDLKLWQARLVSELGSIVKKVGYSSGIAEALKKTVVLSPSVYVVPKSEQNEDRDSTGFHGSLATASTDIVIVARDYGDATGNRATDELKTVTDAVFSALNGWLPSDASTRIHQRSSKRYGMLKGALIWVVTYDCQYIKGE